jgi:hypothetical protein
MKLQFDSDIRFNSHVEILSKRFMKLKLSPPAFLLSSCPLMLSCHEPRVMIMLQSHCDPYVSHAASKVSKRVEVERRSESPIFLQNVGGELSSRSQL